MKLRISSAAPTSSTSASAVSTTTSAERTRLCLTAVPERPLASFNVVTRSGFDVCSAGKSPKMTPVTTARPSVNATTRQSSAGIATAPVTGSVTRGKSPGMSSSSPRTPHAPRPRPSNPPNPASSTLSVNS